MPRLFKAVYDLGGKKERLVVCAAGGAEVMGDDGHFKIGSRNRTILRKLFWKTTSPCGGRDRRDAQSHADDADERRRGQRAEPRR